MSWLYSRALVEEYSGDTFSDGEPSVQSNGNPTQLAYLPLDRMTDFSRLSRFGMTFKPLTEDRGEALLMSYLADFHAKTSALQDEATDLKASGQECGNTWRGWLAKFDPDSCSWKTAQCSLLGEEPELLQTLPRWGMTVDGVLLEQQTVALRTNVTESGLWPTPIASDSRGSSGKPRPEKQVQLADAVRFPTPTRRDYKSGTGAQPREGHSPPLSSAIGGTLNPDWVEWLMNWPITWSGLNAINRKEFQRWQEASATALQESGQLRTMWWDRDPSQAPSGQRPNEQPEQELGGSLQQMPWSAARQPEVEGSHQRPKVPVLREDIHLQASQRKDLQQGVWKQTGLDETQIIPRVASGVTARVDRLKAIGNGQVPAVAATAWRLLA